MLGLTISRSPFSSVGWVKRTASLARRTSKPRQLVSSALKVICGTRSYGLVTGANGSWSVWLRVIRNAAL